MDTRTAGQPKVLIDIDPKLKQKMRETLDALAQYLLQKKPEDPVKIYYCHTYSNLDSLYGSIL